MYLYEDIQIYLFGVMNLFIYLFIYLREDRAVGYEKFGMTYGYYFYIVCTVVCNIIKIFSSKLQTVFFLLFSLSQYLKEL